MARFRYFSQLWWGNKRELSILISEHYTVRPLPGQEEGQRVFCEIWQWKLEDWNRNCQGFWSRTKDMHYRNVEPYVAIEDTWKLRFPHLSVCSEITIWYRQHFTRWSEHWSVYGHLRNLIVAKQVNKSRKTILKPARYLDCVSWNIWKPVSYTHLTLPTICSV